MKRMYRYTLLLIGLGALSTLTACQEYDEEPPVNAGYKVEIRIPDSEELTPEDLEVISKQQAEFNANKGKI